MSERNISSACTSGGIPVVVENVPGARSAGCMIAVATGSRDESDDIRGISHLLEHTVFRATPTRDSYQMAKEMEGAGGEMNAFTGREMTAFYGITISETADVAKDLIGDIVANCTLTEEDTELEKKIVLQELSMIRNEPESYIHDLFETTLWRGHPLSQDEGGDEALVADMTCDDLRAYYEDRYRIPNFGVYCEGSIGLEEAVEWAEATLDQRGGGHRNPRSAPPTPVAEYSFVKNDSDHCHVAMGFPAYGASDERRIPSMMLSAVLGSGTSSRLFQAVREENALVYSVYNSVVQCSDASSFTAYMSCTDDNVVEAMETVAAVYSELLKEGLEKGELDRAKRLMKGANVRSMESTESRMYRLAVNHMLNGSTGGLEERLARIDAVTEEQVMAVAEDILRPGRLNTVVLGKGNGEIKGFDRSRLDF